MELYEDIALKTAEYLLQIKAIKLNNATPFIWASGMKSPIYCDNRKTLSFPEVRSYLVKQFCKLVTEQYGDVDVIAGVATGAIAMGVLVAQELGKPFVYIRSSQKSHGLENKIEGVVESGQTVVVIEDLISTGQSSLNAVTSLRDAGCQVKGMAAIFTYQLPVAQENFESANCPLITLTNYTMMLKNALASGYVSEQDEESLKLWRKNPQAWGSSR